MPLRSNPKSVILWGLLFAQLSGGALQQHSHNAYHSKPAISEELGDGSERRWASAASSAAADSLHTPIVNNGQSRFRDTYVEETKATTTPKNKRASQNERALATFAPAEDWLPAVRDPPALSGLSAASAGGRPAPQPVRSLQDWQVEDIMLLATVDGKIHARDRKTGAARWELETNRPMVDTIYAPHSKTEEELASGKEDPLWIVEPSEDGRIYVYLPGLGLGMQKLDYTVRELVDLTPYDSKTYPTVTYTADKKTTLFTVDASTGRILKSFSSAGLFSNDETSCRKNPLEGIDDEECKPIGIITLGRTEYTVGITDGNRHVATIHYFEWGPNKRDADLKSKYEQTMDSKYVYTKHDGRILGVDFASNAGFGAGNYLGDISSKRPTYTRELLSPVVRVFDIIRPPGETAGDTPLVILQQPVGPYSKELTEPYENIFVDCTANGSWYALSEQNYPGVTDGQPIANFYNDEMFKIGLPSMAWPPSSPQREKFTGVHPISAPERRRGNSIDAPNWPGIEAPPPENETKDVLGRLKQNSDTKFSARTLVVATIMTLVMCGVAGAAYNRKLKLPSQALQPVAPVLNRAATGETVPTIAQEPVEKDVPDGRNPIVRVIEPAKEIIFPHDKNAPVPEQQPTPPKSEDDFELVDIAEEVSPEDGAPSKEDKDEEKDKDKEPDLGQDAKEQQDVNTPKKKKSGAHRGRRGGKKTKEKEQQQAEARAAKLGLPSPPPLQQSPSPSPAPPSASVVIDLDAEKDNSKVIGPLQINSLMIHTDRVIGQGSCGTSVFEGSFEGRAVAVKRMLSQYYELASQEVSFLQQSDDHPNVIRYFCQQKDDHFLYIAVELCQASLFEVWEAEKGRTEERQKQLMSLKLTIQQDVPKALQQLAAGLYHLHNLRIIHRDIKPQNILVAFPKKNQNNGPRLVISDFGLGKNLPENVSTLVDPTGNAGTSGWKAPELISQPRDSDSKHSQSNSHTGNGSENIAGSTSGVKRAADIFSLGCLFFWVLTDGIHPYEDENGWQQLRELNIKRDHKKMGVLERWSDAYEPMQLITSMLAHEPEHRPTALQVLNHPFFWTPAKRLSFLCDCSDHFEREPRGTYDDYYAGDSYHLSLLEERAEEVIGAPFDYADFLSKLDRHFVDTLGKQRKYSGNRFLDLLRALRNKKNHYEDMPAEVKHRVGPLPEGYLNFWCHRFPRLLMACHEVVHDCGLEGNDRFRGYFVSGN